MNDGSWEGGGGTPPRQGWPTWAKVLLGCGAGCVLLLVVLTASCVYLGKWISKNPEAFEEKVSGFVQDMAKEDWGRFRGAIEQLRTEEGTKALYQQNPSLKEAYPTLEDFQKAARQWRPMLEPVPEKVPDLRGHNFHLNNNFGSKVIGYTDAKGHRVRMTFGSDGIRDFSVRKELPRDHEPKPDSEEKK